MIINFENVNISSSSGPNHFGNKLFNELTSLGEVCTIGKSKLVPDVRLAFIETKKQKESIPLYLRLDGIYFNPKTDFNSLNKNIKSSYMSSQGVIFQSKFNKEMTFKYFGKHENFTIINNGANIEKIKLVKPLEHEILKKFEKVWSSASSWRPWKRLDENIRYFLEHSGERDCMIIAGRTNDMFLHERIFYVGEVDINTLYSIYNASSYFIHLARYDSCPNVVVDARAAGCKIICCSVGGTKEIAGLDATVIQDEEWDFSPVDTNYLPRLNFEKKIKNTYSKSIDIKDIAKEYRRFLKTSLSKVI